MGDAGEGLVDNEGKIQERMDQLKADRENGRKPKAKNPELIRKTESLRLARIEMERQFNSTANPARKNQIQKALEDIDRQMEALKAT